MPPAMEVARAKARAFGKEIARHAADLAKELGLINVVSEVQKFAVNGRSSSFLFGATRIFLEGTSLRKMRLANSRAGDAIRALWHLGYCDPQHIYLATSDFTREDRNEFRRFVAWMPTWLAQVYRSCGTVSPVEPDWGNRRSHQIDQIKKLKKDVVVIAENVITHRSWV